MEMIIDLINQKLLKKRTNFKESNEYRKRHLYFMLDNSTYRSDILEYELKIVNKESISYYLTLLENAITYSNTHIIKHSK